MGIDADLILSDWHASAAALAWQVDLGLSDVIGEVPVSAYDQTDTNTRRAVPQNQPVAVVAPVFDDPAQATLTAAAAASGAGSLAALQQALAAFDGCALKRGARSTVFADGNPAARVLILADTPGRDDDRDGRPVCGPAGQLLDAMFAAIGLSRGAQDPVKAIYITPVLPWRTPGDRNPTPEEIALLLPFVQRHVELVAPDVIITLGITPLLALTGDPGIARARGKWGQALGRAHLPMISPVQLLRDHAAKCEAWADLLSLQNRLRR